MDQEKIGKFISAKRKEKKLTQESFAEQLGVTDRTVSNWENGKNMPDLSLFKSICDILDISINELMSGEEIMEGNYQKKFEENVINTIDYNNKQKEKNDTKINVGLLIFGIIFTIIGFTVFKEQDIISVLGTMIAIYGLNRLTVKFQYIKRMAILLVAIMCIISLLLVVYK